MFKVIKAFFDLQDKNRHYEVGDLFPRKGLEVSEERIAELASKHNKQGVPLIVAVEEPAAEEPVDEAVEPAAEEPAAEEPKKKSGKK